MKASGPGILLFLRLLTINSISQISIGVSGYLFPLLLVLLACVFQGISQFHLKDQICGHGVIHSIPLITLLKYMGQVVMCLFHL